MQLSDPSASGSSTTAQRASERRAADAVPNGGSPSSPAMQDRRAPSAGPSALLLERFSALPRAGKWVALAVLGAGLYLVFNEFVWPRAEAFNNRADRYARVLSRAAAYADGLPGNIAASATVHGPNMAPELESVAKSKLAESVAGIMRTHGVNFGWNLRWNQIAGSVMPSLAAELGGTMHRAVAEIEFEAAPDIATRIIHDIDREPAVDAITDVKINYLDKTRRVKVTMTVERWGVQVVGGAR